MRGSGRSSNSSVKPTAQSTSAPRSWPTSITASPIVFTTRALSGSVPWTPSTKRSTNDSASSSPSSSVKRV